MARKRQGKLLPMVKFREIIRLHELGRNQTEIARSCGVSRSTVQDYTRRADAKRLSYAVLCELSDSEAQALLGKQTGAPVPAKEMDFSSVHKELSHKGVTLSLLWQEGLDRGDWTLSYGQFCRRYNQWKGTQNLSMRQIHKPGDKLFVDYAGLTVPVIEPSSGAITDAQIFVACLGASNYTYAEATESQALPHWLGSHQRAMLRRSGFANAFFGGVPAAVVPDNLKSGVTEPCRYEPGIIRSYQDFAEHYGVAILPARVRKPKNKSKVEKAVQTVERQILAPLRHQQFTNFTDLNSTIRESLDKLNNRVMKGYGLSRHTLFERTDQPALKPLPAYPFILSTWKSAKVNLDYHLEVAKHYYSVPYWFVGRTVEVKISEQFVEVFFDHRRIAAHPRSSACYRHSTLPDHMPPEHWAYKRQSKERFLSWAEQIGPHTHRQVSAIFDKRAHEEQAFRSIRGLQRLATTYGHERLELACRRANTFGMTGLRRLKAILKSHLDEVPIVPDTAEVAVVNHDNLRGQQYYS